MIKAVVNRLLKAALSELFLDAANDSVQVSMGADLFSDSNIFLKNLTFRPDIFDAYLYPLELVSGHLGNVTIEGFAELALGGKLKCSIENFFLAFRVDAEPDAQRVQFLRKLLIELSTSDLQQELIRELLKKIQGFSTGKDPDFKKKRSLLIRSMNYLFSNVQISIKTIHIRIEGPSSKDSSKVSALGFTIPLVRLSPGAAMRPEGLRKDDPLLTVSLKGLQVYADYECDTYAPKDAKAAEVLNNFTERWKSESHIAVLLPLDLELVVGTGIQKRAGLFSPKISISIPAVKVMIDPRQLSLMNELLEQVLLAQIRVRQLQRIRVAFTRDEIPRVYAVGGSHILPQLSIGQYAYPSEQSVPKHVGGFGLVSLLKAKMGTRWRKALWKHLIRLVLEDIRYALPLGKWIKVANLAFARRDYAFAYSKLLKKSKDTGNFIYNVNGNADPEILRKLFEYEMRLPLTAIMKFRTLAHMIALVELFNAKRLQVKTANSGASVQPYENLNLSWRDLLVIQTELFEAQEESAFKAFSKRSSSSGVTKELVEDDEDDAMSVISESNASEYSYAGGSVMSSASRTLHATPGGVLPTAASSTPASSSSSAFSFLSRATTTPVAPPKGVYQHTMRMFQAVKQVTSLPMADDLDSKIFGRSEMLAFGDIFGKSVSEEKTTAIGRYDRQAAAQQAAVVGDMVQVDRLDPRLLAPSPPLAAVKEAVRWAMLRHQRALTMVPPDIRLLCKEIEFTFRMPMYNGLRESIGVVQVEGVDCSVTISTLAPSSTSHINIAAGTHQPAAHRSDVAPQTPVKSSGALLSSLGLVLGTGGGDRGVAQKASLSSPASDRAEAVGAGRSGVSVVRSLQGFTSLVGSLIQLKLVVSTFDLSVIVKDRSVEACLNGLNIDNESSPTPSDSMDDSSERLMAYLRQQQSQYEHEHEAHAGDAHATAPFTVLQAMQIAEKEEEAIIKKASEPIHVPILSCNDVKNPFLTLCLMLDFDETTEGAADVQVQLGPLQANISGGLLSRIMDSEAMLCAANCLAAVNDFYDLIALAEEKAYVIDAEHWLSCAVMSYFGVVSTSTSSSSSSPTASDSSPASLEAISLGLGKGIREATNSVDEVTAQRIATARITKIRRDAAIENLNFTKWHIIARHYVPTVLTICIRTAAVNVNALSACTIRNMVLSVVQRLADKASSRSPTAKLNAEMAAGLTIFRSFVQILHATRDLNSREREFACEPDDVSSISFPAFDVVMVKTQTPFPLIDIKVCGIEIRLPVSDETLCQGLAVCLGSYVPFYR